MNGAVDLMESDRPVDVTFLTDDLGGGTGNHLLSMIRHWNNGAWDLRIISRALLTARIVPDIPIEYIRPTERFAFYPIGQMRSLVRIGKSLAVRPAGILHTFFFWPIIFGRLLKLSGKVRILVENREDLGFNWGRHEYTLLRMTSSLPDLVICVCDAVRQVVLDREGLDEERVVVIRNGVEPASDGGSSEKSARDELGFGQDDLVVGMVANYNRTVKGVEFLIEAIPRIVASVPGARFVLIGGGGDAGPLREKARALSVEPFVYFTGYRNDVERFYAIMDISVLTSLSEGLSLTILESMAHGLPVVATRVGGNPEIIMDGQTGYLVPPGDVASLADRIVRLLLDRHLRRCMGEEGRARIASRFLMRDVAARYLEVYRGLISR